ncbi:hypothetical protein [Actinomadura litoris]|uniref:hypothetical protein n=1 Tax=Actinomadura litoris TaxID=2678616 RepID=UPI001FA6E576|nr:hypothetical protein [Actinomadura litoris]
MRIEEDHSEGRCEVHTFVPTMRRPVRLGERYVFDRLPLTDVGYLDIMAWPYPGLTPAYGAAADLSWSRRPQARPRRLLGPPSAPGLTVTEAVGPGGAVLARVVARRREVVRRWEVLEPGGPGLAGLPRQIRAARGRDGPWTRLVRAGEPVPVPEEDFEPGRLGAALTGALTGAPTAALGAVTTGERGR